MIDGLDTRNVREATLKASVHSTSLARPSMEGHP
jgi:hypothetical protein